MNKEELVYKRDQLVIDLNVVLNELGLDSIYNDEDVLEFTSGQDVIEHLEANDLLDVDIIYYHNAIEYLSENDSSLRDSIELAIDCGFELGDIDSEKLASLLATENLRNEVYSQEAAMDTITKELQDVLTEIEDFEEVQD